MKQTAGLVVAMSLLILPPAVSAAGSSAGYPRTQYKPGDIARAKANIE